MLKLWNRKFDSFTDIDKKNVLDIFVHNEKVLVHMYEALFEWKVDERLETKAKASAQHNLSLSWDNMKFVDSSLLMIGPDQHQGKVAIEDMRASGQGSMQLPPVLHNW